MTETTELHQQRFDAVLHELRQSGAKTMIDLGCGPGFLLEQLVGMDQFKRIVGLDISGPALAEAKENLTRRFGDIPGHITLKHGSFTDPDPKLRGFDIGVMLETIEHINPEDLSKVENAVLARLAPRTLIMTTPNQECNALLGVPEHRMRHPDHRFEWPRAKFEHWCQGAAGRHGYAVRFKSIGFDHPDFGGPSQMAVFEKPSA